MANINKLKGKIVEQGMNVETLAKLIGVNKATLYRKLNGGVEEFSIKEAMDISSALSLSKEEATNIFFTNYVA